MIDIDSRITGRNQTNNVIEETDIDQSVKFQTLPNMWLLI